MRFFSTLVLPRLALPPLLALPLLAGGCSSSSTDEAEPFDTLLACYDEHHNVESLTVQHAIVVCCLDHPIAGVHPSCADTQPDCVAHVTAELGSDVTVTDVEGACMDYLSRK